jgi:CRISPR type I-E-associated protein CasB/Cse2
MRTPSEEGKVARRWWQSMQPMLGDEPNRMADPGALAQLRRADLLGAMALPATHALLDALCVGPRDRGARLPEVALVAAVLAQCRADDGRTPIVALLSPSRAEALGSAEPTLKPIRFERLLRAEELEERLVALRRAIRLAAPRPFHVALLASDLLRRDPQDRRTAWILDYHYGAPRAATDAAEETAA